MQLMEWLFNDSSFLLKITILLLFYVFVLTYGTVWMVRYFSLELYATQVLGLALVVLYSGLFLVSLCFTFYWAIFWEGWPCKNNSFTMLGARFLGCILELNRPSRGWTSLDGPVAQNQLYIHDLIGIGTNYDNFNRNTPFYKFSTFRAKRGPLVYMNLSEQNFVAFRRGWKKDTSYFSQAATVELKSFSQAAHFKFPSVFVNSADRLRVDSLLTLAQTEGRVSSSIKTWVTRPPSRRIGAHLRRYTQLLNLSVIEADYVRAKLAQVTQLRHNLEQSPTKIEIRPAYPFFTTERPQLRRNNSVVYLLAPLAYWVQPPCCWEKLYTFLSVIMLDAARV